MAIRSSIDVEIKLGRNSSLQDLVLHENLTVLLDTLDHVAVHEVTLPAGESDYQVPFGSVAQARLMYILATGPIRFTPGGGVATSGKRTGSGGTYPTTFAGGEGLDLVVDGASVEVVFTSADQSLDAVIARINAAAVSVPVLDGSGDPVAIAKNSGADQLQIYSTRTGLDSSVEVLVTTDAAVLTALGLTAAVTKGDSATPGQAPVTLTKPASTSGSDDAAGVPVFFLGTLQTSGLALDSLDSENEVRVLIAIVGDLVSSSLSDC